MTTQGPLGPTQGYDYKGFAGPSADGQPHLTFDGRPPPAPARRKRPALIWAGIAGAVGLGVILGVAARPQLGGGDREGPMAPAVAQSGAQMEIAAAEPPPPAAEPRASGPLEVLPPEYAQAAETRAADTSAAAPIIAPAPIRPQPSIEPVPAPPVIAPEPARVARPSFNCRYARSRAERLVCGDPELAAADRRLAQAFRRATDAGLPYRELRAEQDDWLAIREDAARHSPDAVADVYAQRTAELNAMAEEGL